MSYVNNNQSDIEQVVNESAVENAAQTTSDYPALWDEANLPEYPNAELTDKREGRNLGDGVQVTLETTDTISAIKAFYDSELSSRGFSLPATPEPNEFVYFGIYTMGNSQFTLTATKIEGTPNNKIHVKYVEL